MKIITNIIIRRRQALVKVGTKLFLFGGTSPYFGPPLYFTPEQLELLPQSAEEDTTNKLMDHNDLHVLDMNPSLKTLCLMAIIEHSLSTESVVRYRIINLFVSRTKTVKTYKIKKDIRLQLDPCEIAS